MTGEPPADLVGISRDLAYALVNVASSAMVLRSLEQQDAPPSLTGAAKDALYEALDNLELTDPVGFSGLVGGTSDNVRQALEDLRRG